LRLNKGAERPLFDLKITVKEIQGKCPVFSLGDTFYINKGYIIKTEIPLCMHALSVILPFYSSLSRGVPPEEMGLGKERAFLQCPDPCRYTGGGTVVFEIETLKT